MYKSIQCFTIGIFAFIILTTSANAYTITVDGNYYNISTVNGSASNLITNLQSNPWWNNEDLALSLSIGLQDQLGFSHWEEAIHYTPLFFFNPRHDGGSWYMQVATNQYSEEDQILLLGYVHEVNASNTFTYATLSPPVPEPATMLLFGIGLLGLAGVNRRKE